MLNINTMHSPTQHGYQPVHVSDVGSMKGGGQGVAAGRVHNQATALIHGHNSFHFVVLQLYVCPYRKRRLLSTMVSLHMGSF